MAPSRKPILARIWQKFFRSQADTENRPVRLTPAEVKSRAQAAARRERAGVEPLEGRIAPASLTNGEFTTIEYRDVDGDHVTIRFSANVTASTTDRLNEVFKFNIGDAVSGQLVPQQLELIDLTKIRSDFGNISLAEGTSFTITSEPRDNDGDGVLEGDGKVNVGAIKAIGITLNSVMIEGDLGQIDIGSDNAPVALKSLTVGSLGAVSGTQAALVPPSGQNAPTSAQIAERLESRIIGAIGTLTVQGDVGALTYLHVVNGTSFFGTSPAVGKIGTLKVAGSIGASTSTDANAGTIDVARDIGSVSIGGNLLGGAGANSGSLIAGGKLGSVIIGGKLLGGSGATSGSVSVQGDVSAVAIGGGLEGGKGVSSGAFSIGGTVGKVSVLGDLRAGEGSGSATISSGGKMGPVTISGSLDASPLPPATTGGAPVPAGANSAGISAGGTLSGITIGGSIIGGGSMLSGFVEGKSSVGAVTIAGSVLGGAGTKSGTITSAGDLASVFIGGQLAGGTGLQSGSVFGAADPFLGGGIGSVTVDGVATVTAENNPAGRAVVGGSGNYSGVIYSGGAIGSIKLGTYKGDTFAGAFVSADANSTSLPLLGGGGKYSGAIVSEGPIGSLALGAVRGGSGEFSGSVTAHTRIDRIDGTSFTGGGGAWSGSVRALDLKAGDDAIAPGAIGKVTNSHFAGGAGAYSGVLWSDGGLTSIERSSIAGGTGAHSGSVFTGGGQLAAGNVAKIALGTGTITGGTGLDSGTLHIGGRLGVLSAAALSNTSVFVGDDLRSLSVTGNLENVNILARGQAKPGKTTDLAIGKIAVGGNVSGSKILAGYTALTTAENSQAQIGSVVVGGNWTASSMAAGVVDGGTGFGNADDQRIRSVSDKIISRIASVKIGGTISGTDAEGDHFGFVAQQIGAFQYGSAKTKLALDKIANGQVFALIGSDDVSVREVQSPVLQLLDIRDGRHTLESGQVDVYTIHYQNQGTQTAQNVFLTAILPADAQFDAASSTAGWVDTGEVTASGAKIYKLSIDQLAARDGKGAAVIGTAQFALKVNSAVGANTESMQVQIGIGGGSDPAQSASLVTLSDRNFISARPLLAITELSDSATSVEAGGGAVYTIKYLNQGTQDAREVFLTAELPKGAQFDAANSTAGWVQQPGADSAGTRLYTLVIGNLSAENGPGAQADEAKFAITLDEPVAANFENLRVKVFIDGAYNNDADKPASVAFAQDVNVVAAKPVLKITELSDGVATVSAGQGVVYTVKYQNQGTQDAHAGAFLTATVPVGTQFDSANSTSGWFNTNTTAADGSKIYKLNIAGALPVEDSSGAPLIGEAKFALTVNDPAPVDVSDIKVKVTIDGNFNNDGDKPAEPHSLEDQNLVV